MSLGSDLLATANVAAAIDLYPRRRIDLWRADLLNLDQCRSWKVAGEELSAGTPNFGVLAEVGHKDLHGHDVVHASACSGDRTSYRFERTLCLLIHAVAGRSHSGNKEVPVAVDLDVGPSLWRRSGRVWCVDG